MDFTNVKLFTNSLRQDMSTNVKYFSTGGCYSNSKFFNNDIESISNHLLKLTTQFSNLNGGFGSDFHEQRMFPTIISLKNVIINSSLPLSNIYTNLSADLINSTTNMSTNSTNMVMSQFSNLSQTDLTDYDNIELRKSLSPKRFYNNQQLQMKVKNMKKSPNLMFYRSLIEEIAAEHKMTGKIVPRSDEEIGVESLSTPDFVVIENTSHNKLIEYEIRFKEAKRKKLPQKFFKKCTDNAAKFAEPINILELENENHNQISPSNGYKKKSSTSNDILDDNFEMININNEFMITDFVDDESEDDDDSFIEFDDISDDDADDDESSDSDNDDDNTPLANGSFKNNATSITRTRLLSDCDSEDSFIVFAEDNDEEDSNDQNRMSLIQEEEESGDESEVHPEDEPDCCSSPKQTQLCNDMLEKTPEKKVHFKPDSELCIVHPMIQWSFAYQRARKGIWEEAARDRSRFQCRLRRMSDILKPILDIEHRNKIYTERFQDDT